MLSTWHARATDHSWPRDSWAAQEEAFKKRISQLEWKEEMYNSLQLEKDAKV